MSEASTMKIRFPSPDWFDSAKPDDATYEVEMAPEAPQVERTARIAEAKEAVCEAAKVEHTAAEAAQALYEKYEGCDCGMFKKCEHWQVWQDASNRAYEATQIRRESVDALIKAEASGQT